MREVDVTYTELINSGRTQEANQLRDAAERFARAGSRAGISSAEQIESLNQMRNAMRTAAQVQEGTTRANAINQKARILDSLVNLDKSAFTQALTAARDARGEEARLEATESAAASSLARPAARSFRTPTRAVRRPTLAERTPNLGKSRSDAIARESITENFINPFTTDPLSRAFNPNQGFSTGLGAGAQRRSPFGPNENLRSENTNVTDPSLITTRNASTRLRAQPSSPFRTGQAVSQVTPDSVTVFSDGLLQGAARPPAPATNVGPRIPRSPTSAINRFTRRGSPFAPTGLLGGSRPTNTRPLFRSAFA
jgi:hypothetical protein